ncbi:hypothetical protein [Agromyces humi]|uniref:hypothetical protein n=1 Tax=Agromyces humi TaxID=1766800 RepID=UPI001357F221|nr:hypothetical protein [Agromyces humi]
MSLPTLRAAFGEHQTLQLPEPHTLPEPHRQFWLGVPKKIVTEQRLVNEAIDRGEIYVVRRTASSTVPTIHRHQCASAVKLIDRGETWEQLWTDYINHRVTIHPGITLEMPVMMDRTTVENLPAYTACNRCTPALSQTRKRRQHDTTPTKLSSIAHKHIGRTFVTLDGTELGELISFTVTADGITLHFPDRQHYAGLDEQIIVLPASALTVAA